MIIPKLSLTCFVIKEVRPFLFQESLKMVYYSYFHSIMMYTRIFWGNSYYSKKIFRAQKKNIRIIMRITYRDLVGNISGNKNITVTFPIYSHFHFQNTNYLSSNPRYRASVLELNLIYINHYLIYNLPKRNILFWN